MKQKKPIFYVLNGFFIFLFMGAIYAWSVFVTPLEQLFGWQRSETSLAFTLNMIIFPVGGIVAGTMSKKKIQPGKLLRVTAILVFVGFMLTSFVTQAWQVYITYSALIGFGVGFGYNVVLANCPGWYPEKIGSVTGLMLLGYALSTAVLTPVFNAMISAVGILVTFRIIAVVFGLALFIGSLNLVAPPEAPAGSAAGSAMKSVYNVGPAGMVKKPVFYGLMLMSIMNTGCGMVIINHAMMMCTEQLGAAVTVAGMVVSIVSIANGFGRMGSGLFFDKFGTIKTFVTMETSLLIGTILTFAALKTGLLVLFVPAVILVMICYGGNASMNSTAVRKIFGSETFALNYSIYSLHSMVASVVPTLIGVLQVKTGGYDTPVVILIGFGAVALALCTSMCVTEFKKIQ